MFCCVNHSLSSSHYRQVKGSIDSSLRTLTGEASMDWADTRADVTQYRESAAELIIFNLTLLTHVATDTSNLILVCYINLPHGLSLIFAKLSESINLPIIVDVCIRTQYIRIVGKRDCARLWRLYKDLSFPASGCS